MTNETQRRAEATLDELRNVTSLVLPEPQGEVVALAQACLLYTSPSPRD